MTVTVHSQVHKQHSRLCSLLTYNSHRKLQSPELSNPAVVLVLHINYLLISSMKKSSTICPVATSGISLREHRCRPNSVNVNPSSEHKSVSIPVMRIEMLCAETDESRLLFKVQQDLELGVWTRVRSLRNPLGRAAIGKRCGLNGSFLSKADVETYSPRWWFEGWSRWEGTESWRPQRWTSGLQKDSREPVEAFPPLHLLQCENSMKKRWYWWSGPYHAT